MRPLVSQRSGDVGFQIAPMIDVVFVILVFFMALAAQIRIERILQTRLPGVAPASEPVEFFDEQVIQIDAGGAVYLNEDEFDRGSVSGLPQLTATLRRVKESSDAARTSVVVTVLSHPDSRYARTIDVLNALAAAGVTQVSFASGETLEP